FIVNSYEQFRAFVGSQLLEFTTEFIIRCLIQLVKPFEEHLLVFRCITIPDHYWNKRTYSGFFGSRAICRWQYGIGNITKKIYSVRLKQAFHVIGGLTGTSF